ncbi:MAG: type II toxin-antitoxin system VapC family toxin [Conexibacter sp.]
MSYRRGILDTSTVILLPQLEDPSTLPDEPLITTVTLAELSVGPLAARDDAERAARQAQLQQAEADFVPLPFDAAAARAFGRVSASLRRKGRKPAARALDALIAATALANELPLYTANPSDFRKVDGLEVVAVEPPS